MRGWFLFSVFLWAWCRSSAIRRCRMAAGNKPGCGWRRRFYQAEFRSSLHDALSPVIRGRAASAVSSASALCCCRSLWTRAEILRLLFDFVGISTVFDNFPWLFDEINCASLNSCSPPSGMVFVRAFCRRCRYAKARDFRPLIASSGRSTCHLAS